jgi:hypothetical protein
MKNNYKNETAPSGAAVYKGQIETNNKQQRTMTTIVSRNNRKLDFSRHSPDRKEMGTGAVNPATGGINCAHASAERASEDQPKEELGPDLKVSGKNRKGRRRFTCRAAGKTYKHRGCFGGAAIQNLPSAPFWVDPDPCPALAKSYKTEMKIQREIKEKGAPKEATIPSSCTAGNKLRRKAIRILRLLKQEQSLKTVNPLPTSFCCGSLRSGIRSMFGPGLTLVQELSIKTSGLAESQPCSYCKNLQEELQLVEYEKARYAGEVDVNEDHLERFTRAFASNIESAWNRTAARHPYVPNGHAALGYERKVGGNWNESTWSDQCAVMPVFTKGKWRTVTVYSSHNVEVLTPLHHALYDRLKRRGWLLVGSPTHERLRDLQSGCSGTEWLSFDYIGATDNIKTAYVQRAVDILIDKGEGLSSDEEACLRVVAELKCFGRKDVATKGQPMGSPMSFPLLCLINKTIVDMALTDLLIEGKIGFKEWTRHRCLINGDDLLTRSTSKGLLEEAVFRNGKEVGMESNLEKTLKDSEHGEINSTVFKNCVLQKKTNVSALWMSSEVTDVLGYAHESCDTVRGFLQVVRNNASRLARQKIKTFGNLPWKLREALVSDRQVKKALMSHPAEEAPMDPNLFPVVPMPDGYDLSREEEAAATLERVREVRQKRLFSGLNSKVNNNRKVRKAIAIVTPESRPRKGVVAALKPKKPRDGDYVLQCFASRWDRKRKEELLAADSGFEFTFTRHGPLNPFTVELDKLKGLSSIAGIQQMIKNFNKKRRQAQSPPPGLSIQEWWLKECTRVRWLRGNHVEEEIRRVPGYESDQVCQPV